MVPGRGYIHALRQIKLVEQHHAFGVLPIVRSDTVSTPMGRGHLAAFYVPAKTLDVRFRVIEPLIPLRPVWNILEIEECLFGHDQDLGPRWRASRHHFAHPFDVAALSWSGREKVLSLCGCTAERA